MSIDIVNYESRLKLLSDHPLFSKFSANDIDQFVHLFAEKNFHTGETIVIEGDFIDRVFIIVKGKARVIQNKVIVAALGEGEAIGITSEGFFSTDGRRTATIIADTDMSMLSMDIKTFTTFIKRHPDYNNKLEEIITQVLKLDLMKQAYPFAHLSNQEIYSLSKAVKEIFIPANTIIFHKGDIADSCYLIRTGQVEIFLTNENGVERRLALLESPHLLGEAGILTLSKRNASARALTDCYLLVLDGTILFELTKASETFAQAMLGFMVNRFCPAPAKDVVVHRHTDESGQEKAMLENPLLSQYYPLSKEGWFIWQQLDGIQTIEDITIAFFKKYKALIPDVISNLLYSLAETGFVILPSIDFHFDNSATANTPWGKIKSFIKNITHKEFSLTQTDKWLDKLYRKGIFIFYTLPFQLFFLLLVPIGFIAFIHSYERIIANIHTAPPSILLFLIFLIPISTITVLFHEAGHAFMAKKLGYKVQRIGLGWYGLGLIAFVDTSELWVAKRRARIAVGIAGVYVELIIASALALVSALMGDTVLSIFLWLFSLLIYYNAFKNLSPIREYDGYFLIRDITKCPKLRKETIHWLLYSFPSSLRSHKLEIYYLITCLVYMLIATYVLFLIAQFLFAIFSVKFILGIASVYFSLMFAITMFLISLLSIRNEIKRFYVNIG